MSLGGWGAVVMIMVYVRLRTSGGLFGDVGLSGRAVPGGVPRPGELGRE